MTSTLKIYKNCSIAPSKLFIVDSIEDYLSTLTVVTYNNFQYIRQGLKITVKLPLSQQYLDYTALNNFNYCSITNVFHEEGEEDVSEKTCYYFIMKKTQISSSTIELDLEMDTINSFKPSTDFTIEDKTTIHRQHKDRFDSVAATTKSYELYGTGKTVHVSAAIYRYTYRYYNEEWKGMTLGDSIPIITIDTVNVGVASYSFDSDDGYFTIVFSAGNVYDFSFFAIFNLTIPARIVRKVDLLSEGITPLLYGENIGEIKNDELDWYLVYLGSSTITALACPSSPIDLYITGDDVINPNDLVSGTHYYLMEDRTSGEDRVTCVVTTSNGTKKQVYFKQVTPFRAERYCLEFYTDGTNIYIRTLAYMAEGFGWQLLGTWDWETCTSITISGESITAHTLTSSQTSLTAIYGGSTYTFTIAGGVQTIMAFSSLDRTLSELVKIIKLPYAPLDTTLPVVGWTYNSTYKMLEMSNPDLQLSSIIYDDENPLDVLNIDLSSITITDSKSTDNESKLFHSDYYQPKFVYDSFTKVFALERINLSYYEIVEETPFIFNFVATNTINSKFVFRFTQYKTDGKALDDFENILTVSRNNEMPIFNSDYLNYVKTGFNYDVKNKNRQEVGQWIGTGVALVGAIASFVSVPATHGFGIAGGLTLASTALMQLTNAVNHTAQAEAAQSQKLMQLRQQKDSVYGADDVDLLSYYCNNKAKLMLYKVSNPVKKTLWDLFFYTGYICGYRGIPNYTSRTWFNFVSCELEIDESSIKNISEVIMNDIKAKYAMGVTFLHKNVINTINTWDFSQSYENWETSLF